MLKKIVLGCLLAAGGVVVALALMEIYLRTVTRVLDLSPWMFRTNATRRYELIPRFRGWTYDKPIRINTVGLRDSETTVSKPQGLIRILCLGDSITFGQGVRVEDTYPKQLEEMIRDRNRTRRVQVLNFGVPSYNTMSEVVYLKERGLAFDPDVVILEFTVSNDAETAYFAPPVGFQPLNRVKDPLRRLYLYKFLALKYYAVTQGLANLDSVSPVSRVEKIARDFSDANQGWKDVTAALDEFVRLSAANSFVPIVMIFPVLEGLDRYPYGFAHDKLRATVGSRAQVVDLLPHLERHRAEELWVSPADGHPNTRAHRIISDALFDVLTQRGLLK